MQVLFESGDPEGAGLRQATLRRVRFVLRRLSWLAPRVRLHDVNGPRGGIDKHCQVELRSAAGGTVVVAAMARDWHGALDAALSRAVRRLLGAWRRAGGPQRRAATALAVGR